MNTFVNVTFITSNKIFHCLFLRSLPVNSVQQCAVNVTYGSNCNQHLGTYRNTNNSKFVVTPPLDFIDSVSEYCLSVAATSNNETVIVKGILNLINTRNNNTIIINIIIIKFYILMQVCRM